MSFLDKLDAVIAGKSAGPWKPNGLNNGRRMSPDQWYFSDMGDQIAVNDEDVRFIVFMANHAELIRDALKAATHLQSEVRGALSELDRHGELCATNQGCLIYSMHKVHRALKALDEAAQ